MTHEMTAAGLQTDPLETITSEIVAAVQYGIAPVADLSSKSPMGAFLRILAERESAVVEAIEEVYAGQYPSTAYGFSLDLITALSGTYRNEATESYLLSTESAVQLNAGITLAVGSVASVDGSPDSRFVTDVAVTNPLGAPAWVPCAFTAEATGPTQCLSGTLGTIAEPQAGWTAVWNTADATLGIVEEEAAELRIRRVVELAQGGSATINAIRADLSALDGMVNVIVKQNVYDWIDGDGIPANSVAPVVYDGTDVADPPPHTVTDAVITEAIYGVVGGGIRSYGDETYTHTDDEGNDVSIGFTRAAIQELYIVIDISTDGDTDDTYIEDAALKALLVAWGTAAYDQGDDVVYLQLVSAIMDSPVNATGVKDITTFTIDWVPAPVGVVNLPVTWRQIAEIDTARITVTS